MTIDDILKNLPQKPENYKICFIIEGQKNTFWCKNVPLSLDENDINIIPLVDNSNTPKRIYLKDFRNSLINLQNPQSSIFFEIELNSYLWGDIIDDSNNTITIKLQ